MRMRPKRSPSLPRLTTRTLLTMRKPWIIQSRKKLFPGANGSRWIPRKITGMAISMIVKSKVASSTPTVVLESATHL